MEPEVMLHSLSRAATMVLTPIAVAAVTAAAGWLAGWLRSRIRNETVRCLIDRLDESVRDAVRCVNQQAYDLLGRSKRADNPGTRRLTMSEAQLLRNTAVNAVSAQWGLHGMRRLAKALDLRRDTDDKTLKALRTVLETKIEAQVNHEKRQAS